MSDMSSEGQPTGRKLTLVHSVPTVQPPQECLDLGMRFDGDVPLINSRDVGKQLDNKRHDNVLRDIEAILASSEVSALERAWFRPVEYIDAQGKPRPSYDLTEEGFQLLTQQWKGPAAMRLRIRCIKAFHLMREIIRSRAHLPEVAETLPWMNKAFAAIAELANVTNTAVSECRGEVRNLRDEVRNHIDELPTKVRALVRDAIADTVPGIVRQETVRAIAEKVPSKRRNLTDDTRREHDRTCITFYSLPSVAGVIETRCPCCEEAIIFRDDAKCGRSEYDHYFDVSDAAPDKTWLICGDCHDNFSDRKDANGVTQPPVWNRHFDKLDEFRSYQRRRKKLPPQPKATKLPAKAKPSLFGPIAPALFDEAEIPIALGDGRWLKVRGKRL